MLIGHNVGVGDDESVFGDDKSRTARYCHLPLRKYQPEKQKQKKNKKTGGRGDDSRKQLGEHFPNVVKVAGSYFL